jgi:hypothetical protein
MNRRNFVAAVPVLAAGLTSISSLMASPLNTVSEQSLMEGFDTFFKAHRSAATFSERAMIDQISTPVSAPKFKDGKLTFKVKSGETATLFHWKGETRINFA